MNFHVLQVLGLLGMMSAGITISLCNDVMGTVPSTTKGGVVTHQIQNNVIVIRRIH